LLPKTLRVHVQRTNEKATSIINFTMSLNYLRRYLCEKNDGMRDQVLESTHLTR